MGSSCEGSNRSVSYLHGVERPRRRRCILSRASPRIRTSHSRSPRAMRAPAGGVSQQSIGQRARRSKPAAKVVWSACHCCGRRFEGEGSVLAILRARAPTDRSASPTRPAEESAPLVTTGHSLGGALAAVAAYNIHATMSSYLQGPVTVYTFGAPSIGNPAFQMKVDKRVPHHFRVVVDGDLVTMTTRGCGLLEPCCTRVRVPQQCGTLVLLDSDSLGNIIVAPTVVEALFRGESWNSEGPRRNFDPKVSHKIKTYDLCLKRCFDKGTLRQSKLHGAPQSWSNRRVGHRQSKDKKGTVNKSHDKSRICST